eukprot:TRINITY_DN666_c0_g1_i1.p1 TRINITY_DN666_c0_g1~~TRINITY_DN666_c0_g1_i1.p1  ORF type:complete len:301 (-),score=111.96 TRINITY_DN666_c0_g1_i1:49-951(-)
MLNLLFVIIGSFILFCVWYWLFSHFIAPPQPTRRKVAIATWNAPSEGNIYGKLEIDASNLLEYIEEKKNEGIKITITNTCIKAVGCALKATPTINGHLIWGKFFPNKSIDVGCLVNIEGGKDLANAKIQNADALTIEEIGEVLRRKAEKLRKGKDQDYNKTKNLLKILPPFAIKKILYWGGFVASSLGLNIPALGVKPFPFGSCLLTSVGMMGLDTAYVPFAPFSRVPLLVMVGAIQKKPVVIDDEVVIRPILTVTATIDHRFMDGAQGAILANRFKEVILNPQEWNRDVSQDDYSKKNE